MAAPRSPRRMSPQRRREQLVAAAVELYGRMPPEQVSVDDVARAADVSRALFYRYFRNVGELHVAALAAVVDELVGRLTIPPGGSLVEDLHAAIDVFLTVVEEHADAYVALLRSGSAISTGETDRLVDGVRDHIAALLEERVGGAAPSPLFRLAVRGWIAVVEGACLHWLQDGTVPRERLRTWLADQLVAMLRVTAEHDAATSG